MPQGDDYVVSTSVPSPEPPAPVPAPAAPVDDTPPGDSAAPASATDESASAQPAPDSAAEQQRRRDRAFAEQRRRIEALEAENARLRQPSQVVPQEPTSPRPEEYHTQEEWLAAYTKAQVDAAVREALAREARSQAQDATQTVWERQEEDARSRFPDYDAAVQALDVPFHPAILNALQTSDLGADVAYYLATHAKEAQALATLAHRNPTAGVRALGAIEGRLSMGTAGSRMVNGGGTGSAAPRGSPVVPKPAPPSPLPGTAGNGSTVPPDQLEYDDYVLWYKKTHGHR